MQVPVMPSRPHEDAVVESFRDDPGFALYMLSHSLEEGDEAVFLTTLRRVAKAFGGISQVARQANLNETTSTGCFPGRAIRSSAASWLFWARWACGWPKAFDAGFWLVCVSGWPGLRRRWWC